MSKCLAAGLAALFCFVALPAAAATTGIVRGNVLVESAPRVGVALTLRGEGTLLSTKTDSAGNYLFSQVPFGHYELTAQASGVPAKRIAVDVQSDEVATVNIVLGELKVIATTTATTHTGVGGTPVSSNTLGRSTLAALPTNNSLNRVVQTVPGIVRFSYDEPVAHGFHGVSYEIDGAPIPQATSSNFAEIIDPKNVDSVEVFTGAFPAEYGGQREGAVINIVTNRLTDFSGREEGTLTVGGGNQGQALTSFNDAIKAGKSIVYLSANSQRTDRGLDSPTFVPIHDNSSQSDEFFRIISPVGNRSSLAFDFSNQLAQFQIPINTDPNNAIDPQVAVPGTDDVQREYDRYASLNLTQTSRGGVGIFQVIPWYRYTRIAYDGDLAKDVLGTQPDPNTGLPTNLIGLRQDRFANDIGLRMSQLWVPEHHAVKIGIDLLREDFTANQLFAQLGQPDVTENVAQAGSHIGAYVQDKWSPSRAVSVSGGLRYDHSTGFTGGWQLSPRIGVNLAPDANNVVHFYYGRMYAAPQLEDVRQACVALNGCPTVPVYSLQPERDAYAEIGVAHTFSPTVSGYVNYFRRSAVNVLDTTQLLNTPLFAVFNNALGRDEGVEFRLQGRNARSGDSWFLSTAISHAEAAGVSGSTFLFPPDAASNFSWQPEDHDQLVEANGAYTHRFGQNNAWYATLESEYGTGFPVQFESGTDRLPSHLTFDLGLGRSATKTPYALGFSLDVENVLNRQYVIKIANGFNTTQIATGRKVLLRLTQPF